MNAIKRITCGASCMFLSAVSFAAECRPDIAQGLMESGQTKAAIGVMEGCAARRNVSGETLMSLARLYEEDARTSGQSEEALLRAWSLKHKAAVNGSLDALIAITRVYANGDNDMKLESDQKRHACLVSILKKAQPDKNYKPSSVIKCLTAKKTR